MAVLGLNQIEYDKSLNRFTIQCSDYKAEIELGVDTWTTKLYREINNKYHMTYYRNVSQQSMILDEHMQLETYVLRLSWMTYDQAVNYLKRLPAYEPKSIQFEDMQTPEGKVRLKIYQDAPVLHIEAYREGKITAVLIDRVVQVYEPKLQSPQYIALSTVTGTETIAEFKRMLLAGVNTS